MLTYVRFAVFALVATFAALPAEARSRGADWVLLGEERVGFRTDRDVINVADGSQRFSQLRIEAEDNDVFLTSVGLVYQNGFREEFRVGQVLKPGENALPVELGGPRSYLKQIELVYRARPDFRGRAVVKVYGELQERWRDRRPAAVEPPKEYEWLGTLDLTSDDRRADFDIGRDKGRFVEVRLKALDGNVRVGSMRITFANGETQRVDIDERLSENELSRRIDLQGDRRAIRSVALEARASRRTRTARLILLGKPDREVDRGVEAGRGRGERQFDVVGTETVTRADRRVRFDVGRREGRFGAIRFKAEDGDVRIQDVRITFGNGETQKVTVEERLDAGEMTAVIDLEGEQRFIRDIVVEARPRRGEGRVKLTLLGREREGRGGDRREGREERFREEWVTIGRAGAAMFKADTDTFQVGREAGVFRAIRVAVYGSDVRFYNLSIRYGNGDVEEVPLSGTIADGQVSQEFDLKGRDRFIDSVSFRYRSRISLKGPSRIEVQGLKYGVYRGR